MHTTYESYLGIFLKEPVPEKVKTRLVPNLTYKQSAYLYRAFVLDTIEKAAKIRCAEKVICYSPPDDGARRYVHDITPQGFYARPQKGANLGERMREFLEWCFEGTDSLMDDATDTSKHAVIIGSDSPTLPCVYIQDAIAALNKCSIVIGPSMDGGYYLIGVSKECWYLFEDIAWSTETVFLQTVQKICATGERFYMLPPWYDVDTPRELEFLKTHLMAMKLSESENDIPIRTFEALRELGLL